MTIREVLAAVELLAKFRQDPPRPEGTLADLIEQHKLWKSFSQRFYLFGNNHQFFPDATQRNLDKAIARAAEEEDHPDVALPSDFGWTAEVNFGHGPWLVADVNTTEPESHLRKWVREEYLHHVGNWNTPRKCLVLGEKGALWYHRPDVVARTESASQDRRNGERQAREQREREQQEREFQRQRWENSPEGQQEVLRRTIEAQEARIQALESKGKKR